VGRGRPHRRQRRDRLPHHRPDPSQPRRRRAVPAHGGARPLTLDVVDLAVVGDGPAGLALAAAAHAVGVAVTVVGDGRPWTATYGTWRDDVADLPANCFATTSPAVVVHGHRRHLVERAYAIVDNDRLRAHLFAGIEVRSAHVERIRHMRWGSRLLTSEGDVDARLVVDATGRPPATGIAAQSAFGVVVDAPPVGVEPALPTLMDLRPAGRFGGGPPTFVYAVPVADGWLVEETVLAARPAVPADDLAPRLAARIGTPPPRRTERVTIAVGGSLPARRGPVPRFGTAAGYAHPTTGYSVAASLRAAPRVAAAIADACRVSGRPDARPVHDAVWPPGLRRTRWLHAYGLEVLLRLDQDELAAFFDVFFDLPVDVWAPYLRVDAASRQVTRTMTAVLRRLPRGLRRRLLVDPRGAWS
jgi:lycopene beta-cyclase